METFEVSNHERLIGEEFLMSGIEPVDASCLGEFHASLIAAATELWAAIQHADEGNLRALASGLRIQPFGTIHYNCFHFLHNDIPATVSPVAVALLLLGNPWPAVQQFLRDPARCIQIYRLGEEI